MPRPLSRGRSRIRIACLKLACIAVVLLTSTLTNADALVVIVNPASGVGQMTRSEVASIYMARTRTLAPGVAALPLDIAGDASEKRRFYSALLGKTLPEVNAYWARLLFTGRATPPQQIGDEVSVVATVAENKGAIGYVSKGKINARVKVILELVP